ncbi:FAD binding domain-containing protein [Clathrospora elynae]|uniref:FAD binding domain-containing protein n=1 Tax=Clathrospora elynae TaxID=706981 RepID=A0A6A5S890_9PLEO|nr:FAD binding domain-containing protein [Clathrospora elynae]
MGSFMCITLATLLLGAHSVLGVPTPETISACAEIENALPGKVLTRGLLAVKYAYETQQYWSTTLRYVDPACIVQPVDAVDVSVVIKTLNKYPTVNFATRSGGHDPNVGHATIQDGVLITMTDLTGATYDAKENVAYVKPGGEWNDVIGDLEKSGVAISGGRLGEDTLALLSYIILTNSSAGLVGVGGLLLGGGISFLSAQEGLAADNIIGWETVMANGSIINVDAAARPDLAQAMRGSGGQFGVVTQFKVKVHPIGDVWGGFCIYDQSQEKKLYAALHNFVGHGAEDPKAAIIFSDLVFAAGIKAKLIFYFYDGPERPASGPFADFFNGINLTCLPQKQKYSSLLRANGEPVRLLNARAFFRTYTVPYIASRPQMYAEIRDKLANITTYFLNSPGFVRATQFSVDFQPLPSVIGKISQSKGGNAMGLTASDPDRIILMFQGAWNFAEDDALAYGLARQLTDWLDVVVPQWISEAGLPQDLYLPFFMNDGMGDQAITQSYRDYEKFKALQESVDPNGLFSTRAGGFKY